MAQDYLKIRYLGTPNAAKTIWAVAHDAEVLPRKGTAWHAGQIDASHTSLPHICRMDPLSVSASIIAILQLTGNVIQYINGVKGSSTERQRFLTELNGVNIILIQLQDHAEEADEEPGEKSRWSETLQSLNQQDGPLQQLEKVLRTLESKLAPARGIRSVKNAFTWPFQKEEVKGLIAIIERQKTLLGLARQNDHLDNGEVSESAIEALKTDIEKIGDDIAQLKIGMPPLRQLSEQHANVLAQGQELRTIHRWLSAPDPSTNHNAAIKKRNQSTGFWFTEGQDFNCWKTDPGSCLWLNGLPGCGKTIFSSTIIENIRKTCLDQPGAQLAYFYFNFNKSLDCDKMIRSILMQLSRFGEDMSEPLKSLFEFCQQGSEQPKQDSLLSALYWAIEITGETFVILDALDECENRGQLLDCLSNIELDIEECLSELIANDQIISMQNMRVSNDICTFVRDRLQTGRKLRRWQNDLDIQQEVETTLIEKADSIFRWAACQLDLLGNCLTKNSLRQALKSLPKDLDTTYDRILGKIREEYQDTALKILQWLAYAARPPQLEEIAEVVAINVSETPPFDAERRLQNPWDIMMICPNLLTAVRVAFPFDNGYMKDVFFHSEHSIIEVIFAHFSVKEYLVSSEIQERNRGIYSIREVQAQTAIAEACIAYLLRFDQPNFPSEEDGEKFPLAAYAAYNWHVHVRRVEDETCVPFLPGLDLLSSDSFALQNSLRIRRGLQDYPLRKNHGAMLDFSLCYAASSGLLYSVMFLVEEVGADVNFSTVYFGRALNAAVCNRHYSVVQYLLEKGADVNAMGSKEETALQMACTVGDPVIAQMLIEHGANVYFLQRDFIRQNLGEEFIREMGIVTTPPDQYSEDDSD